MSYVISQTYYHLKPVLVIILLAVSLSACVVPPETVSTEDRPLIEAIKVGSLVGVKNAIAKGANPKGSPGSKYIPIQEAAYYGHEDIIDLLIEHGADINIKGKKGYTALHWAAIGIGNPGLVKLLISKGADVNATNDDGYTPLHTSVENGARKIAEILLDNGADIHARTSIGANDYPVLKSLFSLFAGPIPPVEYTVLHVAATSRYGRNSNENDQMETAKFIIDKGIDVDVRDNFGSTPLHTAVLYNDIVMTEFFISNGADLYAKDNKGRTAFDIAVMKVYKRPQSPDAIQEAIQLVSYLRKLGDPTVLPNVKVNVGQFTSEKPGLKKLTCGLIFSVELPDGVTFEQYTKATLIKELKTWDMYSRDSSITLTGHLNKIDFSSLLSYWDMTLTINSSNKKTLAVSNRYKFGKVMYGTACDRVSGAVAPAIAELVRKLILSPKFKGLFVDESRDQGSEHLS